MPRCNPCVVLSQACADARDWFGTLVGACLPGRFFFPVTEQIPSARLEATAILTLTAEPALLWKRVERRGNPRGIVRYNQTTKLLSSLDTIRALDSIRREEAISAVVPAELEANLKHPDKLSYPSISLLASLLVVGLPNIIAYFMISFEGVSDAEAPIALAIAAGIAGGLNNGLLSGGNTEGIVYDFFEELIRPFLISLFKGPDHWSLRFYHFLYLSIVYGTLGFGISISGSLFASFMRAANDELGLYDELIWLNVWFFVSQVTFTTKTLMQGCLDWADYLGVTGGDAGAGRAARAISKVILDSKADEGLRERLLLMLISLPKPTAIELRDPVSPFNEGLRDIAKDLDSPWLGVLGMILATLGYVIPNSQSSFNAITMFREFSPALEQTTMIHFADNAFEAGLLALPVVLTFGPLCVKGPQMLMLSMKKMLLGFVDMFGGACFARRGERCEQWLSGFGQAFKGIALLGFTFLTIFTSIAQSNTGLIINAPEWYANLLEGCKQAFMPQTRAFSMNLTVTIPLIDSACDLLELLVKAMCCIPESQSISGVLSRKLQNPCRTAVIEAGEGEDLAILAPPSPGAKERLVGHIRLLTGQARTATQFKEALSKVADKLLPELDPV